MFAGEHTVEREPARNRVMAKKQRHVSHDVKRVKAKHGSA
jgi:hypothetical protein